MKIKQALPRYTAILVLGFTALGIAWAHSPASEQVIRVPGAIPIQFDQTIPIDVQSNTFEYSGHDLHVINIGKGTFHLSPTGDLTATFSAGILQWVDANYWISAAVFDSRGHLLGTAAHQEAVSYIRIGAAPMVLRDFTLDFGVSDSFPNARYVVVAISERKSLPSE